jgi:hypothetical protein
MIGHHFAASAFTRLPSASGDCCSRGKTSSPSSASRACTAGSASASTTAALSLSIMSLGVPFGANSLPCRPENRGQSQFGKGRDTGRQSSTRCGCHCPPYPQPTAGQSSKCAELPLSAVCALYLSWSRARRAVIPRAGRRSHKRNSPAPLVKLAKPGDDAVRITPQ